MVTPVKYECDSIDVIHTYLTLAVSLTQNGAFPDSKVHGANMGPTWFLSAPGGPHVGPMHLTIGVGLHHPQFLFETLAAVVVARCRPVFSTLCPLTTAAGTGGWQMATTNATQLLFTKRCSILLPNLVKSRRREIGRKIGGVVLKCVVKTPVKFQSDQTKI